MHLKYFLIALSLIVSSRAFPQIAEWSTPQKPKNKTAYVRVLGYNDEGYFLHRSSSRNFSKKPFIEYYRSSLGLEYTQPLPRIMKRAVVERILLWGNYIFSFYSRQDIKTGRTEFFVQKFDIELNPKGPYVKLGEALSSADGFANNFRIVHSRDKSRIWCFIYEPAGNDKIKLSFVSLSEQMMPLQTRSFEFASSFTGSSFNALQADDLGNVLLLASSPLKMPGPDKKKFTLIRYNTDKNTLSSITVDSVENRIGNAEIAINHLTNELILTGIYSDAGTKKPNDPSLNNPEEIMEERPNGSQGNSDSKTRNAASGYVFCRFSIDSFTLSSCVFNKFDKALIAENIGEVAAEKGKELSDLTIRKLIPRSDAGVIMILENFYVTQQSYSYVNNGVPQTQMRSQYNYDNIMMISLNPDGSTEWKHVIKKSQVAMNDEDYYSSFVTMITPDTIHILYNEKPGGGDVMHYTIRNTGSIDHKILFKSINSYVFLMPREAKQLSNNVMLLATIKDRKFCLLKLLF